MYVVTVKKPRKPPELAIFRLESAAIAHAAEQRAEAERLGQRWHVTYAEAEQKDLRDTDMLRAALATVAREVPGCYHALAQALRGAPPEVHVEFYRLVRHLEEAKHHPSPGDVMRALARGGFPR